MKTVISKRIVFAGKSLLWSLLLYTVALIVIDSDELMQRYQKHRNDEYLVWVMRPLQSLPQKVKTEIRLSEKKISLNAVQSLIDVTTTVLGLN